MKTENTKATLAPGVEEAKSQGVVDVQGVLQISTFDNVEVWCIKDGEKFPLPQPSVLEPIRLQGKWLVVGYLRSTKSKTRRWSVKCNFNILKSGKYNPGFRVYVTNIELRVFQDNIDEHEIRKIVSGDYISQWHPKGCLVLSGVFEKTPERVLSERAEMGFCIKKQGHLEIFEVKNENDLYHFAEEHNVDTAPLGGQFYGHQVVNGCIVDRWNNLFGKFALLYISEGGGWIVSPSHPLEPIWLTPGWYILTHPGD